MGFGRRQSHGEGTAVNRHATASEFKERSADVHGVPYRAGPHSTVDRSARGVRKQAEQEAATVAMSPTSGESAATQVAFNW